VILNSLPTYFHPPSITFISPSISHTNHKPARQSGHQQFLSTVHKALYLVQFSYCEIVGKAYFSNISALLSKLDRAQHSDLVLTIFLEVSI